MPPSPPGPSHHAFPRSLHWSWLMLPMFISATLRGFWAPDEPRYAEVARELHASGDFLVMHLCGQVYPDKPPLLFWLAGIFGRVTGWSEFGMRLVSIISTALTAHLVARLAAQWWGVAEARLAPCLFLGTVLVGEIGGRLQIDPLLTACILWALWEIDGARLDPNASRTCLTRAGLATGLAALAKGPVAFVIVLLVAGSWRWLDSSSKQGLGSWIDYARFLALALTPVLAWALLAAAREPMLYDQLLFRQHLGRAVSAEHHPGPLWKYCWRLPLFLLPWTLPVLCGVGVVLRGLGQRRHPDQDVGMLRAGLWFLALFLFFSILPTKRDLYLLPAYPAAALLAARWLLQAARANSFPRWVSQTGAAILTAAGALFMIAGLLASQIADRLPSGLDPSVLRWRALLVGLVFLLGGSWSLLRARRGQCLAWTQAMLGTWCLGLACANLLFLPLLDPYKSARELGEWLAARPERPKTIPCIEVRPEGYRFYGQVPTVHAAALGGSLDRDPANFLALVRESVFLSWPERQQQRFVVLRRASVGSRDILVLGAASARQEDPKTGAAERRILDLHAATMRNHGTAR